MEGVVTHDFRFRLEEPRKKRKSTGDSRKSTACGISKKRKGPCIISLNMVHEHGSGVTQSPFLCLCNSRNMVVDLLTMVFLRLKSLLRKNLSVELKKLDFYFNICH